MALKIPPPPPIASADPQFNRWLLELTSILSNQGGIDPSEVTGLPSVITQVGVNTADIANLGGDIGNQGAAISVLQSDVTTINSAISTINGQITSLSARAQLLNGANAPTIADGNNNDWWASTGATKHVYVKLAGAWVLIV